MDGGEKIASMADDGLMSCQQQAKWRDQFRPMDDDEPDLVTLPRLLCSVARKDERTRKKRKKGTGVAIRRERKKERKGGALDDSGEHYPASSESFMLTPSGEEFTSSSFLSLLLLRVYYMEKNL